MYGCKQVMRYKLRDYCLLKYYFDKRTGFKENNFADVLPCMVVNR